VEIATRKNVCAEVGCAGCKIRLTCAVAVNELLGCQRIEDVIRLSLPSALLIDKGHDPGKCRSYERGASIRVEEERIGIREVAT
jgi:hypothetical protein